MFLYSLQYYSSEASLSYLVDRLYPVNTRTAYILQPFR
jgi:hypothetical protein